MPRGRRPGAGRPLRTARPRQPPRPSRSPGRDDAELVVGRNPVVEALRALVPSTGLYVALGVEIDARVREAVRLAGNRGVPVLDVSRPELDRMSGGAVHQGLALQVPPYAYADADDVLRAAHAAGRAPLLVALDGVTDPRNLGAIVRSAAAFGADGVLLPVRRSAGMTAVGWRASAGTAAWLPVARVTNLVRALNACREQGLVAVGLDGDGETSLDDLELAVHPMVLVVGSEGRGLGRLVRETCDLRVAIPMVPTVQSLNASVASGVALAEIARRRRQSATGGSS